MHIFNIHTNIQQNKRLLTKKKTVGGVSGTNEYPVCNIYYQLKGQTPAREVRIV
jgi:hypothetical protein